MSLSSKFKVLFLSVSILVCTSCREHNETDVYGIFQVLDEQTVQIDGVVSTSTIEDFELMLEDYPLLKDIQIKEIPGSNDDEINLEISLMIHEKGMSTHLLENAVIASGGVDLFLAGINRTSEGGTMIGVHSWSNGTDEATDFPEGHEEHLPYIEYFMNIGFTQQEAEDFYYFTINAAPFSSIHYMTEEEIDLYSIFTE